MWRMNVEATRGARELSAASCTDPMCGRGTASSRAKGRCAFQEATSVDEQSFACERLGKVRSMAASGPEGAAGRGAGAGGAEGVAVREVASGPGAVVGGLLH